MTTKKLPLYINNTYESPYGNFGVRLGAFFLEGLILFPLSIGMLVFNSMNLYNYFYTYIIFQILFLTYSIYLPVRYGATPGKRLLGLTILKIDGSPIGYREAFLKVSPAFIIGLLGFALQCYLISKADATTFNEMNWLKQNKYLQSFGSYFYYPFVFVLYGYYISNLIVFLKNDRKRSIGDQIAGTVVVYTRFVDKLKALNDDEQSIDEQSIKE